MKQHDIDARRVYVAGLSAGGAMASIMGAAYPEIFAALGVHSGLPRGAASNWFEALALMTGGAVGPRLHFKALRRAVPTIVFHGDQDKTVHPRNGEQVIVDMLADGADAAGSRTAASQRVKQGVSARGRRYTRSIRKGENGVAVAEHWLVHGAGHAWSGGQAQGSYTDAMGPDATLEMLRFFFAQAHPATHS